MNSKISIEAQKENMNFFKKRDRMDFIRLNRITKRIIVSAKCEQNQQKKQLNDLAKTKELITKRWFILHSKFETFLKNQQSDIDSFD